MRGFRKLERVSTWRRIAVHAWGAPRDPSVHGTIEVDATELLDVVRELRERSGARVTVTHVVGRALALAIRARPDVNAIVRSGSVWQRETINVFFQVAFEGGENLAGHKVARADEKSVVAIAKELSAGAGRVREKRGESVEAASKFRAIPSPIVGAALRASTWLTYNLGLDLSRLGVPFDAFGSAMVTNVAGFGLSNGLPPLFPPSRCPILVLVGEVAERPWVHEGVVVPRPVLSLGVTFDHRLLDGFQAGTLAKRFREVVEHPRTALADELSAV